MYDSLKAKVNVASIGVRGILKRITKSGCHVQMQALEKAKQSNPEGRWWIKAEACDVRKGLRESMRGIWAGDGDLGDGSLQALPESYKERCVFVKSIGSTGRSGLVQSDI